MSKFKCACGSTLFTNIGRSGEGFKVRCVRCRVVTQCTKEEVYGFNSKRTSKMPPTSPMGLPMKPGTSEN